MQTIEYLLSVIIKIAFGLLLVVCVFWLIGLLYPQFKPSSIFSRKVFSLDWLPAPKNYGSLLGTKTNDGTNGKVYVPGPAFDGYANTSSYGGYTNGADVDWIYYTASGTQVVHGSAGNQVFTGDTTAYAEKSLYIRNLSIYEGGNVAYGTTFVGEARDTMFRNGTFPITVIDRQGRVITSFYAVNTGMWATAGWARFQATISTILPRGTDCALVFHSANQNLKVGMAVRCN
jgi:hypothetical protein